MNISDNSPLGKVVRWGLGGGVLFFFGALFFHLTHPIIDPDFWWHLATGRWMWENNSLMHEDPFNFIKSAATESPLRRDFILKQYWLSQLFFFLTYKLSGFKGLVILRALLGTAMFATTYALMRKKGAGQLVCTVSIMLISMILVRELGYLTLRPQIFSSLFAVVVILLLEHIKEKKKWAIYTLPAIMLIWANMHGGFILGDVIIIIYAFVGTLGRTATRGMYISWAAALALSGLNPSGYAAFLSMALTFVDIERISYWSSVIETQSLFSHGSVGGVLRTMPELAILIGAAAVSFLFNPKELFKGDRELIAVLILVTIMGYKAIRFIIFFAVVSSIIMAINYGAFYSWLREKLPYGSGIRGIRHIVHILAFIIIILLAAETISYGKVRTSLGMDKPYKRDYEDVVRFLKEHDVHGNIFNDYNEGGYLIWWLTPEVKVFSDGRALSMSGFKLFNDMVTDPFAPLDINPSMYSYEAVLMQHNLDMIVIPGCDKSSGVLLRLNLALLDNPQWHVVYADAFAIVYAKNTFWTQRILDEHKMDNRAAYDNILHMARESIRSSSHGRIMPGVWLAMAVGHKGRKDYYEAYEMILEYIKFVPEDPYAQ
jgi:hypothetical protein